MVSVARVVCERLLDRTRRRQHACESDSVYERAEGIRLRNLACRHAPCLQRQYIPLLMMLANQNTLAA